MWLLLVPLWLLILCSLNFLTPSHPPLCIWERPPAHSPRALSPLLTPIDIRSPDSLDSCWGKRLESATVLWTTPHSSVGVQSWDAQSWILHCSSASCSSSASQEAHAPVRWTELPGMNSVPGATARVLSHSLVESPHARLFYESSLPPGNSVSSLHSFSSGWYLVHLSIFAYEMRV